MVPLMIIKFLSIFTGNPSINGDSFHPYFHKNTVYLSTHMTDKTSPSCSNFEKEVSNKYRSPDLQENEGHLPSQQTLLISLPFMNPLKSNGSVNRSSVMFPIGWPSFLKILVIDPLTIH